MIAQHLHLAANWFEPVLAGEAVCLFDTGFVGVPQRMFPTAVQAKYSPHTFQHFVGWPHARWSPGTSFFIGEMDGKAMRVLILNTGFCEFLICPVAKACEVPSKHVVLWFAVDDPLC